MLARRFMGETPCHATSLDYQQYRPPVLPPAFAFPADARVAAVLLHVRILADEAKLYAERLAVTLQLLLHNRRDVEGLPPHIRLKLKRRRRLGSGLGLLRPRRLLVPVLDDLEGADGRGILTDSRLARI